MLRHTIPLALSLAFAGLVHPPDSVAQPAKILSPASADQLIRQGLMALQSNQLTDARTALEQATHRAPTNAIAWTSLAQVYWRLEMKPKAMTAAATAEETGAGNPIVAHALALLYAEMNEFKRAAVLEGQYARSPNAPPGALASTAGLYFNAGEMEAALRAAREAVQKDPSPAAKNILGKAAWANEQRDEALANLSAASKEEPANSTYAFDYSQILFRKGDFGAAADSLNAALAAHPDDSQLYLSLGVARYGQRRFDDAATAFLKTISIDPSLPQPYDFLGKMLDQLSNRISEITSAYEARYKREPRNFAASYLLAKVRLAAGGDPGEIENLLLRSIAENKDFWASHFELGELLAKRRQYREAAVELNSAIALSPNQPMPHYHLARVYDRLGENAKAQEQRDFHAKLEADQKGETEMK